MRASENSEHNMSTQISAEPRKPIRRDPSDRPPPSRSRSLKQGGVDHLGSAKSSDLVNLGPQVFESLRPQVFVPKIFGRFAADFCPTPSVCTKNFRPLRGRFLSCPKCFTKIFWPRSGPNFFPYPKCFCPKGLLCRGAPLVRKM